MTADAGSTSRTRILIVDDHPIVRLGVRQMIATDPQLSICGEADSVPAALAWVRGHTADLAIVDLSLAGGAGLELIRELRQLAPQMLVLVLSMHDEMLFAVRALKAGARGYIMKQEAIEGLVGAIRQILTGRTFVSDRVSQGLLAQLGPDALGPQGVLEGLTDRELEVFEMIGRGQSTSAIADHLGVSVKTIETYRSNLKTKLGLTDATALIRYATTWAAHL